MSLLSELSWLSYVGIMLLIAGAFVSNIVHLRLVVAAACVLGVVASIVQSEPVHALVFALAVAANLFASIKTIFPTSYARLNEEEKTLYLAHFATLKRTHARRLIDEGHWVNANKGEFLVREDETASSLFYLAEGQAEVKVNGTVVGHCIKGDLIGEATVLTGDLATGTVRLAKDSRLWFVPALTLRSFLKANPVISAAMNQSFAKALRTKLAIANTGQMPIRRVVHDSDVQTTSRRRKQDRDRK